MTPIPITDQLPQSPDVSYVLAYAGEWVAAMYHPECGWAFDARWGGEGAELPTPTHWLPYPPKPEEESRG